MENNIKNFINLVMNEELAKAQETAKTSLNNKLNEALGAKFEKFAPSIFEAMNAKPDFLDLDKDGDTKEPMKKAAKEAEQGDEDEAKGEESDEKEEEGESEDEDTEESDEDSEEDTEDSEEEQD